MARLTAAAIRPVCVPHSYKHEERLVDRQAVIVCMKVTATCPVLDTLAELRGAHMLSHTHARRARPFILQMAEALGQRPGGHRKPPSFYHHATVMA
eukprot:350337-Chlamydomonas_euryale.AAC.10